jgi:hypothetical protein
MSWVIKIVVFFLVLLVIRHIVEVFLRKIYKIEEDDFRNDDGSVNDTHYGINLILGVVFFVVTILLDYLLGKNVVTPNELVGWFVLLLSIGTCIKIYFEWKYEFESKQFILSIGNLMIGLAAGIIIILFDFLN